MARPLPPPCFAKSAFRAPGPLSFVPDRPARSHTRTHTHTRTRTRGSLARPLRCSTSSAWACAMKRTSPCGARAKKRRGVAATARGAARFFFFFFFSSLISNLLPPPRPSTTHTQRPRRRPVLRPRLPGGLHLHPHRRHGPSGSAVRQGRHRRGQGDGGERALFKKKKRRNKKNGWGGGDKGRPLLTLFSPPHRMRTSSCRARPRRTSPSW